MYSSVVYVKPHISQMNFKNLYTCSCSSNNISEHMCFEYFPPIIYILITLVDIESKHTQTMYTTNTQCKV